MWGQPGTRPIRKELGQSLADNIKAFKATEGSTDNFPLLLGVKRALWSKTAKKSGNWYRGVVDAAGCFMMKRRRTEADKSWPIHATVDAKNSNKGKREVCV